MSADAALRELETDPHRALAAEEVHRRLERFDPNELKKQENLSPLAWRRQYFPRKQIGWDIIGLSKVFMKTQPEG